MHGRDEKKVERALLALERAAADGANIMPPSIEAAKAGVTTGEWAGALRRVFGEYRAPTGISGAARPANSEFSRPCASVSTASRRSLGDALSFLSASLVSMDIPTAPSRLRCVRAIVGIDVVYDGIRLVARRDRRSGPARTKPDIRRPFNSFRLARAADRRRDAAA